MTKLPQSRIGERASRASLPLVLASTGVTFAAVLGLCACLAAQSRDSELDPSLVTAEVVQDGIGAGETAFTIRTAEDQGVLRYNAKQQSLRFTATRGRNSAGASALSAARRMQLLRPLLRRLLEAAGPQPRFTFGIAGYREVNGRLVAAAAQSDEWDLSRGRAKTGTLPEFVVRLMNARKLYPELEMAFSNVGYDVKASAAENVLVLRASQLDQTDRALLRSDLPPNASVPASAAVYFEITRRR